MNKKGAISSFFKPAKKAFFPGESSGSVKLEQESKRKLQEDKNDEKETKMLKVDSSSNNNDSNDSKMKIAGDTGIRIMTEEQVLFYADNKNNKNGAYKYLGKRRYEFKCPDCCKKLDGGNAKTVEIHLRAHMISNNKPQFEPFKGDQILVDTMEKLDFYSDRNLNNGCFLEKEKLFKCPQCVKTPYTTNLKGDFKKHLLKHVGAKKFICEKCNAAFLFEGTLKEHMTSHSKERPFECDLCTSTFKLPRHLKDHIKAEHPESAPPSNDDQFLLDLISCDPAERFTLISTDANLILQIELEEDKKKIAVCTKGAKGGPCSACLHRLPVKAFTFKGKRFECDPSLPCTSNNSLYGQVDLAHPEIAYWGGVGKGEYHKRQNHHHQSMENGRGGCPLVTKHFRRIKKGKKCKEDCTSSDCSQSCSNFKNWRWFSVKKVKPTNGNIVTDEDLQAEETKLISNSGLKRKGALNRQARSQIAANSKD